MKKNTIPLLFIAALVLLSITTELGAIETEYVISEDEYCMALNIYHESRSENLAGKFAVADVVLNRVDDNRYPNTVCGVVKQAKLSEWWLEQGKEVPIRDQCQFSWYCDGRKDEPNDGDAWRDSLMVAYQILKLNQYRGLTEGATHYHANYIDPYWAPTLQQVGTIGSHIFYRQE